MLVVEGDQIRRDIDYLERTMREVAAEGPEQAEFIRFTAGATAFFLAAQFGAGRSREHRLNYWRREKSFDRSVGGVARLMRRIVAKPGTPQAIIASMTVKSLSLSVASIGDAIESGRIPVANK